MLLTCCQAVLQSPSKCMFRVHKRSRIVNERGCPSSGRSYFDTFDKLFIRQTIVYLPERRKPCYLSCICGRCRMLATCPPGRCPLLCHKYITFANVCQYLFSNFFGFFSIFSRTTVLFKKLRLIISPAHMRTHTYAHTRTHARARVYIDSFRFSFQ